MFVESFTAMGQFEEDAPSLERRTLITKQQAIRICVNKY
jgi:hypothetical protein